MVKEGIVKMKKYSQSKATQYVLYVLTFSWERHTGGRETAQRRLQHLELRQRDLPPSSIVFNNLDKNMDIEIIIQDILLSQEEEVVNTVPALSPLPLDQNL